MSKPQIFIESTFGNSHPGSGHLDQLVEAARQGIAEAGGHGARYFCTDMCDGESQGTDGINFSLASREMIANMVEGRAENPCGNRCHSIGTEKELAAQTRQVSAGRTAPVL